MTAKRAPEAPARGLEWVVMGVRGTGGWTGSCTTLRARSGPLVPPCPEPLGMPPPGLYGEN